MLACLLCMLGAVSFRVQAQPTSQVLVQRRQAGIGFFGHESAPGSTASQAKFADGCNDVLSLPLHDNLGTPEAVIGMGCGSSVGHLV
jgi:hypothetical protein